MFQLKFLNIRNGLKFLNNFNNDENIYNNSNSM